MPLKPRAGHFDKRVTVQTPLQTAGAYLLTGVMDGGNTSDILMWVSDTAIVKKPLSGQSYTFRGRRGDGAGDRRVQVVFRLSAAVHGDEQQRRAWRSYRMDIQEYVQAADKDGQVIVGVGPYNDGPPPAVDRRIRV